MFLRQCSISVLLVCLYHLSNHVNKIVSASCSWWIGAVGCWLLAVNNCDTPKLDLCCSALIIWWVYTWQQVSCHVFFLLLCLCSRLQADVKSIMQITCKMKGTAFPLIFLWPFQCALLGLCCDGCMVTYVVTVLWAWPVKPVFVLSLVQLHRTDLRLIAVSLLVKTTFLLFYFFAKAQMWLCVRGDAADRTWLQIWQKKKQPNYSSTPRLDINWTDYTRPIRCLAVFVVLTDCKVGCPCLKGTPCSTGLWPEVIKQESSLIKKSVYFKVTEKSRVNTPKAPAGVTW